MAKEKLTNDTLKSRLETAKQRKLAALQEYDEYNQLFLNTMGEMRDALGEKLKAERVSRDELSEVYKDICAKPLKVSGEFHAGGSDSVGSVPDSWPYKISLTDRIVKLGISWSHMKGQSGGMLEPVLQLGVLRRGDRPVIYEAILSDLEWEQLDISVEEVTPVTDVDIRQNLTTTIS